ncbi:hypothetical protein [Chitinibacter tainanensis]|uniref:hypothetical protein n=1 Tax=Chitinibacter tainanensis TaxID=230667 RepID=UPI00040B9DCE|nr:hypothetical protein [Chitinibacter tainanensis]
MASLLEKLQQRKQQADASKRDKTAKLADGKHKYRILPTWRPDSTDVNFHDFGMHYVKHAGQTGAYLCRAKTYGEHCEVCEAIAAGLFAAAGNEDTKKLLEEARSSGRVLMNMIQVDAPESERRPKLFELPKGLFENDILPTMITYIENGLDLASLDKGFEIEIEKSGTGKNTEYRAVVIPVPAKPLPAELMQKVVNIDEWVKLEGANDQGRSKSMMLLSQITGGATGGIARLGGTSNAGLLAHNDALDAEQDAELAALEAAFQDGGTKEIEATPPAPAAVETAPAATPTPAVTATAAPAATAIPSDEDVDALLAALG